MPASCQSVPLAASETMRSQTLSGEGRKSGPTIPALVAAAQAATRSRNTDAAMAMKPARLIRAPIPKSRRRRRRGGAGFAVLPVSALAWFIAAGRRLLRCGDETRIDQIGGSDILGEDAGLLRRLEHVDEGLGREIALERLLVLRQGVVAHAVEGGLEIGQGRADGFGDDLAALGGMRLVILHRLVPGLDQGKDLAGLRLQHFVANDEHVADQPRILARRVEQ